MISQNGQNDAVQVIAAEGEHKASRSLRLAAEVIADSPAALQVGLQKEMMMAIGKYEGSTKLLAALPSFPFFFFG